MARAPLRVEVPDMSHMIPMRISVAKVKAMTDAELLAVLNGEDGRKGAMTMQFLQLITSELQARAIQRASKPHWSTVPSFWLLVTSVVFSLVAIVVAVLSLPQVQQRVFPDQQQNQSPARDPSTTANSQQAPKSTAP
jgi:hypothetical protein